MYYSYVEIEYVATSFSPARTDLALKLLKQFSRFYILKYSMINQIQACPLATMVAKTASIVVGGSPNKTN